MDQQILYEVNEELAYVSNDVRELIDKTDKAISDDVGYQSMVKRATYEMQNRFIRQELDAMRNIVKKHPTGLSNGNLNSTRELPEGAEIAFSLFLDGYINRNGRIPDFVLKSVPKTVAAAYKKICGGSVGRKRG